MSVVLFADDDAAMRAMVADLLRASEFSVRLAADGEAALRQVRSSPPDLAVLDYRMGPLNGFEVCREIKADPALEHVPVLILTAQGEVDHRVRGFEAGADDFLAKPFDPRELVARCRALLRLARQGLDRNPTTHLPGGEALRREFERRAERGEPFCVCYLDLDHFKPFHDRFGFAVADEVIRSAGRALGEAAAGAGAYVGHIGGDDFVVFAPSAVARELVQEAQARFQASLRPHLPPEVMESGRYRGRDRSGNLLEIPLTRLSAALVHVDPSRSPSFQDLGPLIAEMKGRAKQRPDGIAESDLPPSGG